MKATDFLQPELIYNVVVLLAEVIQLGLKATDFLQTELIYNVVVLLAEVIQLKLFSKQKLYYTILTVSQARW